MKNHPVFAGVLIVGLLFGGRLPAQEAREIVRKADAKFNGEKNCISEMTMSIVRPKYTRSLSFKSWAENGGNALTLITGPAKEKGQTFLKNGNNMWSWNPTIQRLIKLPASMMAQGWMGSDFTNDDILKESSLVKDYTPKLLKTENVDNTKCWCIELKPLEKADVIWGKIVLWVSTDDFLELKSEYYDEDGYLVKTHKAAKVATFDGRRLPSQLEITPADEPGNKTVITIQRMSFNATLDRNLFTQQYMKRIQ
jgi:outer membrane lipoprotein-sorting protein